MARNRKVSEINRIKSMLKAEGQEVTAKAINDWKGIGPRCDIIGGDGKPLKDLTPFNASRNIQDRVYK